MSLNSQENVSQDGIVFNEPNKKSVGDINFVKGKLKLKFLIKISENKSINVDLFR